MKDTKNINRISFSSVIISLTICVLFSACYPLSTGAVKWRIKWDHDLGASKKAFLAPSNEVVTSPDKPNIILIVADDLGKFEVSSYGSTSVKTPHIDQLAKEGMQFRDAYVTAPVCAPSRCGILTGRYQNRCGFETQPMEFYPTNVVEYYTGRYQTKNSDWVMATKPHYPREWEIAKQGIPPSEITLGEMMKKLGYATAIVGKWHLGLYHWFYPNERGFDYQFGCYGSETLYGPYEISEDLVNYKIKSFSSEYQWKKGRDEDAAIYENGKRIKNFKEYLTFAIRDKSISFMEQNSNKPFFLYIPFTAPHEPYQAPLEYYCAQNAPDKGKGVYRAIVTALDDAIGSIEDAVKNLGLEKNTIIFFLSDNGPAMYTNVADAGPYKGGKLSPFEGGINVPFIMKWKDKIPAGSYYDFPVSALDIFPTCVAAAGAQLPQGRIYDGVNLMPYISGSKQDGPHPVLYWKADHICTIRKGDYKLIWSTRDKWMELYDLKTDRSEKNNLLDSMPDKALELQKDFEEWNSTLPKRPMWPRIMDHRYVIDGKTYLFPA